MVRFDTTLVEETYLNNKPLLSQLEGPIMSVRNVGGEGVKCCQFDNSKETAVLTEQWVGVVGKRLKSDNIITEVLTLLNSLWLEQIPLFVQTLC